MSHRLVYVLSLLVFLTLWPSAGMTRDAFTGFELLAEEAAKARQRAGRSHGLRATINDEDFSLLIKGVVSPVKEIRLLATEFLYGISDRRALAPSLSLLQTTDDQDAQWNAVLVIGSFYGNLAAAEKESAARELRAANVGEKIRAKINSLL